MLNNKEGAVQTEGVSAPGNVISAESVIATDVSITGNLSAKGALQIDGEVNGDIRCDTLTLGSTAKVKGGVVAQKVVISGSISGTIKGEHVVLEPDSRVDGDILYTTIAIADGAIFDGGLKRSQNPLAA